MIAGPGADTSEEQRKVITSEDVRFSAQKQVKSKKGGHHVRRP